MAKAKRIVGIIQARMASSRLPGKVLSPIEGEPMLAHVVRRVRLAKKLSEVVVATSSNRSDNPIAAYCQEAKIPCFRGSEKDVLDRFYRAATRYKADTVVRITADCPLIDPAVIDRVCTQYVSSRSDYVTNTLQSTFPDGLDVEVFSYKALHSANQSAKSKSEREHVTPYIRNSGKFNVANVVNELGAHMGQLRWTVDEPADLDFVKKVFSRLHGAGPFGMESVIDLLQKDPEIAQVNAGRIRNEGYYLSLAEESPVPARKGQKVTRSLALKGKANKLIPSCSQTFSKAPSQFVQGVAPIFLQKGKGCRVTDVDGNTYIDYLMGLGPLILGYGDEEVAKSATTQLKEGIAYSLPHPLEVEVAEMMNQLIPCADMVRFGKNGSDATAGAVRAARAYTQRELIACCGYHGWQDWYIGTTTRAAGVPTAVKNLTKTFTYNDFHSLEKLFRAYPGQIAAVIMEPVGVEEPQPGFLEKVREIASREGAVLIFDEIITGFRVALGGAQAYYGVTPDLACFGKALGGGFPVSAVAGKREIMKVFDDIFFSFTAGGEAVSLAAAKATLTQLQEQNIIPHLWEQGQRLKDGFNVLAKHYGLSDVLRCVGLAPRTVVQFITQDADRALLYKSYFQQECLKRGLLFAGTHFITAAHQSLDIDETLRIYRSVMPLFKEALESHTLHKKLEGPVVEPVFRKP